jgi:hypothetical protein
MLRDAAHGTDTKSRKVLDGIIEEDEPLRLVGHGGELGVEEIDMVIGRVVRAMVNRGSTLRWGPGSHP